MKEKTNLISICFNIFLLFLEIAIILAFIFSCVLVIGSITILILESCGKETLCVFNILDQHNCNCPNNCYFKNCDIGCSCNCYQNYINTLISILSISLTGVLLPIISALITGFYSAKAVTENLTKELAKVKNIKCYLLLFPLGAWGNLSVLYQKEKKCENKLLSDYNYALHLLFEGEVFQAYDTKIKEIRCFDCIRNVKDACTTLWLDNSDTVSFVADVTGVAGVNGNKNNGSNLTALIDNRNDYEIVNSFIDGVFEKKKLIFTLKIKEQNIKLSDRWRRFNSCTTVFPIIKTIFGGIINLAQRYVHYDFELMVSGMTPTDERFSQYRFNIIDVEMKQVRRKYKKTKIKHKDK